MVRFSTLILAAVILPGAALAQTPEATPPDPPTAPEHANVRVSFRTGKLEGTTRIPVKTYDLIVAPGTDGSKLLSGSRVPFPGSRHDGELQFVYQNVGFSTEVTVWILDGERIKLVADIEDSRVRQAEDGGPPTVETRQLAVNAILTDGVTLELTRAEGINDQSGFVEVEATILR